MLETLNKYIVKLLEHVRPDVLTYILLGVLALAFFIAVFAGVGDGEMKRFRRGVRRLMKGEPADRVAEKMNEPVRAAFRRARTTGKQPVDCLRESDCVIAPYRASLLPRAANIVFFTTLFLTVLSYLLLLYASEMLVATILLLVCGGVLTVTAAVIGRIRLRTLRKAYRRFVARLSDMPLQFKPDAGKSFAAGMESAEPEESPYSAYEAYESFNQAAMPVHETQPRNSSAPADGYVSEQSVIASVPEEDVVTRVDRISREGAPMSVMREVALLLQQERAKPENRTPDRQRRLNDALSKLLKAMSSGKGGV